MPNNIMTLVVFVFLFFYCLADTGTPPRIDGRTIDTSCLKKMEGDKNPIPFSFLNEYRGTQVRRHQCVVKLTSC